MNKNLRGSLITFIVITSVILPVLGFADDTQMERETLRGIRGVGVLVFIGGSPGLKERLALNESQLRREIELELQKAGVEMVPKAEKNLVSIFLLIFPTARELTKTRVLYDAQLELHLLQPVHLVRDSSITSVASTWYVRGWWAGEEAMKHKIKDEVKELVDIFISAYSSVNQKK
jgi:hypothetical protein